MRFPVLKANTATGASLPKGVWRAGAAIVEVSHLHRRYGATVAVEDVSFSVAEGEIFGLLGPNGAGKTTTVESIVGLRVPDAGTIRVLGLDPLADHAALRERVGVQLQESAQPPKLRAGEALLLYASFYRHPDDPEHLMETLGLSDKRETFFRDLFGRTKAATLDRARLDRPPDDRRAGRADHPARPASPARHLGPGEGGAGPRGHDRARDP